MTLQLTIAARLREERTRLQFSQERLAAIAGITRQTQSKYEKGTRQPDALYLAAIAQHDLDVNYIINGLRTSTEQVSSQLEPIISNQVAEQTAPYHNQTHTDDYISLPRLTATTDTKQPEYIFNKHWLASLNVGVMESLSIAIIHDDNMAPHIRSGDIALVSNDPKLLQQNGLFLVQLNNTLEVKRIQHLPDDKIKVSSDNTDYEPFYLEYNIDQSSSYLLGKLIWVGHNL